ncbi:MAG TPA: hypothetical protein VMU02_12140 [bacterium]|nr:hypothetical protein [bacterium]
MSKWYSLILASVICLALASAAMATEIDPAEVLQGSPVLIKNGGSLACGNVIYDNSTTTYFYSTSAPGWNVLDDGNFPAGTAPVCLACVQLAWRQQTAGQLYVAVDFWDTVVPGGPVCNMTWLGGFAVDFGVMAVGGWISNPIELTTPITFPDDNWCVELRFFSSLSPLTPSTGAFVMFANGGPTVGTNDATVYWRDANGNGSFECPGEARGFSSPNKAQFYLKLSATTTPSSRESSRWGAIKALYR